MGWLQKLLGRAPAKPSVTASFRKEPNGVHAVRIGGVLNKATLDNIQAWPGTTSRPAPRI